MFYYSELKRNKLLSHTKLKYYWVNEASVKRLCAIWFQPWHSGKGKTTEMVKRSVTVRGWGRGKETISRVQRVLRIVKILWWYYNGGRALTSGSVRKESACNVRDLGLILGSGRSPGEGNGNPLQYLYLGNGQRSLAGYSPWGLKSWTWPRDEITLTVDTYHHAFV